MDIDSAFGSTCRILFGKGMGGLSEFAGYLSEGVDPPSAANSSASGKPVYLSRPYYCRGARFLNVSELAGKQPALAINDIKDVDSALAALSEKFAYCGSKNLGTSSGVEQSDMCNDCLDVLSSQNVMASKYVAYSNGVRESECVFGCQLGGEVGFSMHSQIFFYSKRCFDAYMCFHSTDVYCSFNCRNCAGALFSFNQNSKRNMIGNLELAKDKYLELKGKLSGEVGETLGAKKRFPTIFELADGGGTDG